MKIKIAVVQFEIKQFSPSYNIKKAERYIVEASSAGADIIVFPEDFITGPIEGKIEFADPEHNYIKYFQNLAKKHKIDIIPGSIIEKSKSGIYNTAYYIDFNGKIKSMYRKINLWHPERSYINPGNKVKVFNTRFGKAGLIICWDIIFPEVFRKMSKEGVELVFCPSYWCYGDNGIGVKHDKNSEIKLIDSLCVARAFENEIIFIYCNPAGKLDLRIGKNRIKDKLLGRSQISVPFKGSIKKLKHSREKMFIQEVDTSILLDAEKVYKIRKDLMN